MKILGICFVVASFFVSGCLCGDVCYYFNNALSATEFYYCGTGCCGYYYSRECCSNVGTIAGSVVGGLIVVAIIIGIIACCVITHKHQQKRIRQERERANVVTIVTAATAGNMSYPNGGHPAPPDYSPFGPARAAAPPPNYGGGYVNTGFGNPNGANGGGTVGTKHYPPPYE